jgi:hypothetical protein
MRVRVVDSNYRGEVRKSPDGHGYEWRVHQYTVGNVVDDGWSETNEDAEERVRSYLRGDCEWEKVV